MSCPNCGYVYKTNAMTDREEMFQYMEKFYKGYGINYQWLTATEVAKNMGIESIAPQEAREIAAFFRGIYKLKKDHFRRSNGRNLIKIYL